MDIVTRAILILFGSSMLFSGGVCFGAWWATRDRPADDWHDNYRL